MSAFDDLGLDATNTAPVESTSKISAFDGCLLVDVTISQWVGRKHDAKVSAVASADFKATADAGRFNKKLLGDELKGVQRAVAALRSHVYDNTLPWGSSGQRVLPARLFMEFSAALDTLVDAFKAEVETFLQNYPRAVAKAKLRLGDMFSINDYPSTPVLRRKFMVNVSFLPMPTADADFRVALADKHMEQIRRSVDGRIAQGVEAARTDLYERLFNVVDKLVRKLSDKDKPVFRDSLFSNAAAAADAVRRLNVFDDARLSRMADELADAVSVKPQEARDHADVKRDVMERAAAVREQMSAFMA